MDDPHDRRMRILLWAMIAAMMLIVGVNQCRGQVIASFHPQFHNKRTTSWEMCATNRGTANASIGMADIYRVTAGRMSVLNTTSRAYEMRMRPRNRWIRGIQIGAAIASLLQATPAIQIGDGWQYLFPGIAGGLQIAQPAIEANRRQDYELGVYWEGTRTLAPGESQCAMVMSLKIDVPLSFVAVISEEVPMDPQGSTFPVNPPLSRLSHPARFDALDWDRQAADAMRENRPAVCVIRPTSVETEGCGAWYG